MKTLLLGFAIIAVLVLITSYADKDRSSVRIINASEHNINITFISEEPHRSYSISMKVRSDNDTYMSLKNGPYIILYRIDGKEYFEKDNIEITGTTIFKITEESGELILKEKEQ